VRGGERKNSSADRGSVVREEENEERRGMTRRLSLEVASPTKLNHYCFPLRQGFTQREVHEGAFFLFKPSSIAE
jgi:hypothetical protein